MQKRFVFTGFVLVLASASMPGFAGAAGIDRIDPPFWWQGFKERSLQLMIYGEDIAAFEPSIDTDGVTLDRAVRGGSENYLFVYLDIGEDAAAGDVELTFRRGEDEIRHLYKLRARQPGAAGIEGFSPKDVIYLVTPDRFANGDPGNDNIEGLGDPSNRSDDYGRHGGDIAGMKQHLDYIHDMGFTQIWPNPLLENAMPKASYHGYATTDFYRVDPRFGSNDEYREFVSAAGELGIGVIMDMIVNHIGSGHRWMADLPTETWVNTAPEFRFSSHARTTHQDPYASEIDKADHTDGWFDRSMPDLNQRDPLLGDYLVQNAIWWVEYVGLRGIRMDTYPYPDKHFMSEWSRRIMAEYPNFNIVGEEWSPNPAVVSYWQAGKQNHDGYVSWLPSLMDFPIQGSLSEVLLAEEPEWGSVWTPLYEMLGSDFLYADPGNLVIFPDNHDMSRIYTQLGEDDALYRMAMVYYATMRGIPQIFYGTEIQMSHPGTTSHGALRADFPGGWDGDAVNAFTGDGLSDQAKSAQEFVRTLLNWRKSADVIHSGKLMQYAPTGNVYAYFRYNDSESVMVLFNHGTDSATVDTGRFEQRIGDAQRAHDVLTGHAYRIDRDIVIAPRSALILEFKHP